MRRSMLLRQVVIGALFTAASIQAFAVPTYGGIEFPDGEVSFADSVLLYDNTNNVDDSPDGLPTDDRFKDPAKALGVPDYSGTSNTIGEGAVSLGRGGILRLGFTNNTLTNSGTSAADLHIFEIGADVENTFVAIRPTVDTLSSLAGFYNADDLIDGFLSIGAVGGATSSIDIDSFFGGFLAGTLKFDAVQLIDDPNEGQTRTGPTVGADIDAVGAIFSAAPVVRVPEPGSLALLGVGLAALGLTRRKRKS